MTPARRRAEGARNERRRLVVPALIAYSSESFTSPLLASHAGPHRPRVNRERWWGWRGARPPLVSIARRSLRDRVVPRAARFLTSFGPRVTALAVVRLVAPVGGLSRGSSPPRSSRSNRLGFVAVGATTRSCGLSKSDAEQVEGSRRPRRRAPACGSGQVTAKWHAAAAPRGEAARRSRRAGTIRGVRGRRTRRPSRKARRAAVQPQLRFLARGPSSAKTRRVVQRAARDRGDGWMVTRENRTETLVSSNPSRLSPRGGILALRDAERAGNGHDAARETTGSPPSVRWRAGGASAFATPRLQPRTPRTLSLKCGDERGPELGAGVGPTTREENLRRRSGPVVPGHSSSRARADGMPASERRRSSAASFFVGRGVGRPVTPGTLPVRWWTRGRRVRSPRRSRPRTRARFRSELSPPSCSPRPRPVPSRRQPFPDNHTDDSFLERLVLNGRITRRLRRRPGRHRGLAAARGRGAQGHLRRAPPLRPPPPRPPHPRRRRAPRPRRPRDRRHTRPSPRRAPEPPRRTTMLSASSRSPRSSAP